MKKLFFIASGLVLCTAKVLFGQNLVPNPSFEDFDQCPDMEHEIEYASSWMRFKSAAEYYHGCDVTSYVGVPYNTAGYQEASSGQAYAGIYTYSFSGSNPSFRDYIGVQLSTPLSMGTKYYISLQVSATLVGNGAGPWGTCKYISNKCGVLFTTMPSSQLSVPNFAHVYTDSIISDTTTWTTIKGSFIADSAYEYVVVGNFFHDSLTTFIEANPTGMFRLAYLYVDDVCVSIDSLNCEILTSIRRGNSLDEILIYPNPCTNYLSVGLKGSLQYPTLIANVYDLNGKHVLSKTSGHNNFRIDTDALRSGIYALHVQAKNESHRILFIKN